MWGNAKTPGVGSRASGYATNRSTTGIYPRGGENSSRMRLISFKPLVKGVLRGFATVEVQIPPEVARDSGMISPSIPI